jgi:hypothetical protein
MGYELIAAGQGKQHTAWITHYWQGEPGCDSTCSTGYRISPRVAAMRREQAKPFDFVLVSLPAGYQLRQVLDTGSKANLRRARARGATHWVDLAVNRRTSKSYVREVWVVSR